MINYSDRVIVGLFCFILVLVGYTGSTLTDAMYDLGSRDDVSDEEKSYVILLVGVVFGVFLYVSVIIWDGLTTRKNKI